SRRSPAVPSRRSPTSPGARSPTSSTSSRARPGRSRCRTRCPTRSGSAATTPVWSSLQHSLSTAMPSDERLRASTDRLARLWAAAPGSEILRERAKTADRAVPPGSAAGDGTSVGVWQVREGALYRDEVPVCEATEWADVAYVPPAGHARRVVLLGESTARGW